MSQVTVILTHQLDSNRKYLDLAIRGLLESEYKDFEVFLVSGAETKPRDLGFPFVVHWDPALNTATKKVEWALQNSESQYVMNHSDDVVLSRSALGEMVSAMQEECNDQVIMNPLSNSDCRSLYHMNFKIERGSERKTLIHDMSYEDLQGWEDELINVPLGHRVLLPFPTLSFYCTLIPRSVWRMVGGLDPALEYRHNDQDFCLRARQLGIASIVNLAPFVFHFGSRTLSQMSDDQIKSEATAHFTRKYSQNVSGTGQLPSY